MPDTIQGVAHEPRKKRRGQDHLNKGENELTSQAESRGVIQHGKSPIYQLAEAVGTRREALCLIDPDPSGFELGCSGTEGRLHRQNSVSSGAENMGQSETVSENNGFNTDSCGSSMPVLGGQSLGKAYQATEASDHIRLMRTENSKQLGMPGLMDLTSLLEATVMPSCLQQASRAK